MFQPVYPGLEISGADVRPRWQAPILILFMDQAYQI